MHHDDDTLVAHSPVSHGPEADAPVQSAASATADADPAFNQLRRALLIYGTAGQAARPGMQVRAS